MKKLSFAVWFVLASGLVPAACGGRSAEWDAPPGVLSAVALTDAVVVTDLADERVLLLTTDADRNLTVSPVRVQRGVRTLLPAPDGSKVFVVSAGDGDARPPAGKTAQSAALEIVTRVPKERTAYPLSEPLGGLALDPRGAWAVLYADSSSASLVRNPNELLLVDLKQPASTGVNPHAHTLRSFGGQPKRFTFTDELHLPGGPRRLLVIETEQDVAIIDLAHPDDPEITIQLTSGQTAQQLHPAGVSVTDGDAPIDDARLAIRVDDSSVIVATLVAGDGRDFRPDLNLTDVGGIPSDATWVRTDAGALALAVLVPAAAKAVLVDPGTGLTQDVALPAAYQRLSLVTAQAGAGAGAASGASSVDVALLWDGAAGGVSFWELGRVAGQPYRSVETIGVTSGVTSVLDVAGAHPELKVLGTRDASFYLLDLKARTSAPFLTSTQGVSIVPSRAGDRAWAYLKGGVGLSSVDLVSLHPEEMHIDRGIDGLFEIAVDGTAPAGKRSLIALHGTGTFGATVYDAGATGNLDVRTTYAGLLTEGIDAN